MGAGTSQLPQIEVLEEYQKGHKWISFTKDIYVSTQLIDNIVKNRVGTDALPADNNIVKSKAGTDAGPTNTAEHLPSEKSKDQKQYTNCERPPEPNIGPLPHLPDPEYGDSKGHLNLAYWKGRQDERRDTFNKVRDHSERWQKYMENVECRYKDMKALTQANIRWNVEQAEQIVTKMEYQDVCKQQQDVYLGCLASNNSTLLRCSQAADVYVRCLDERRIRLLESKDSLADRRISL